MREGLNQLGSSICCNCVGMCIKTVAIFPPSTEGYTLNPKPIRASGFRVDRSPNSRVLIYTLRIERAMRHERDISVAQ